MRVTSVNPSISSHPDAAAASEASIVPNMKIDPGPNTISWTTARKMRVLKNGFGSISAELLVESPHHFQVVAKVCVSAQHGDTMCSETAQSSLSCRDRGTEAISEAIPLRPALISGPARGVRRESTWTARGSQFLNETQAFRPPYAIERTHEGGDRAKVGALGALPFAKHGKTRPFRLPRSIQGGWGNRWRPWRPSFWPGGSTGAFQFPGWIRADQEMSAESARRVSFEVTACSRSWICR